MSDHDTGIEWTHRPGTKGTTWNPIVGCSVVSPGCTNCYAMDFAGIRLDREGGPAHYRGTTKVVNGNRIWTGKVALAEHKLSEPLRWTKPRTIFVNSMGDLFHEDVPDEWIDRVFAVMALCPQHTFIVLTKRAARMRSYVVRGDDEHGDYFERLSDAAVAISGSPCSAHVESVNWPLRNVWLGVSAERQAEADARIPNLLATPAAVRFVSAEPLLGPVDFTRVTSGTSTINTLRPLMAMQSDSGNMIGDFSRHPNTCLDWVIVGGESGTGARPMIPDWSRSIRDQCAASSVSFFMKQMDKKTAVPADLLIREWPKTEAA